MTPSLRQLEAFAHVVRLGSVGAAAQAMTISQPGVSHLMKELQRDIGLTLFIKDGRGLRLTPEGELFYAEAERQLLSHDEMRQQIDRLRSGSTGRLNIACDPSWAGEVIGPPLRRFMKKYPKVAVLVQPTDSAELISLISASRFDVSVMSVAVGSSYFKEAVIGNSAAVVVAPAAHPIAERASVDIEDLKHERFMVLSSRRNAVFYRSAQIFERLKIRRENMLFSSVSELIFTMVESGAGIALMSRMVASASASRYNVVVRPIEEDLSYDIYAGHRPSIGRRTLAQEFIDILRTDLIR